MEQKEWDQRLDRMAERVAGGVKDGVRVLEDAYEKGKETLQTETRGTAGSAADGTPVKKGSPRLGLVLVALGIVWLLQTLGILGQPIFPILLIVLGVYFIARSK